MTSEDKKKEISDINVCRRVLKSMLNDGVQVLDDEERVTVKQVIRYVEEYRLAVINSYK